VKGGGRRKRREEEGRRRKEEGEWMERGDTIPGTWGGATQTSKPVVRA
jgi:hypothetical protein